MKAPLLLLQALFFFYPIAARADAPTCTLAANPSTVQVGDTVSIVLAVSGEATSALIDGVPVPSAGAAKTIRAVSTGTFKVAATVEGVDGAGYCSAAYVVTSSTHALIRAFANHYFKSWLPPLIGGGPEATYSIAKGPSWVQLTSEGALVGKPSIEDLGATTVYVEIREAGRSRVTEVIIDVSADDGSLSAKIIATIGEPLTGNLQSLFGVSGASFTLEKTYDCPDWVMVKENGELFGTPGIHSAGTFLCGVQIVVSEGATLKKMHGTLHVIVVQGPPVKPQLVMKANQQFVSDLTKVLGTTGYFSATAGPSWISVSADGLLVARPSDKEIGVHELTVAVREAEKGWMFTLTVEVVRE